jgi:hypothetical protein
MLMPVAMTPSLSNAASHRLTILRTGFLCRNHIQLDLTCLDWRGNIGSFENNKFSARIPPDTWRRCLKLGDTDSVPGSEILYMAPGRG